MMICFALLLGVLSSWTTESKSLTYSATLTPSPSVVSEVLIQTASSSSNTSILLSSSFLSFLPVAPMISAVTLSSLSASYSSAGGEISPTPSLQVAVRLVGMRASLDGRIEVLYNGIWGTVCNINWDLQDANVVCRELGYSGALAAVGNAAYKYGLGRGVIWMAGVDCIGNETSLLKCRQRYEWGMNSCSHYQDAGVICISKVRLVGGATAREGLLQVYYNNTWGWVCAEKWDIQDADVVCREIGYKGAHAVQSGAVNGQDIMLMNNVQCFGNESSIFQCRHDGWKENSCTNRSRKVGVKCIGLEVRLMFYKGNSLLHGRVEVLYNGIWGTVCHFNFGLQDANVVCRWLGYSGALAAVRSSRYRQGTGAIWMADVDCKGNEASLLECNQAGLGENSCGHNHDAGVICIAPVRLSQGTTAVEGLVQVYYNSSWGWVCDEKWDIQDADVVCREIGYKGAYAVQSGAVNGQDIMLMNNVQCFGNESSIFQCRHGGWRESSCTNSSRKVGVKCIGLEVRLAGGNSSLHGRVEVLYNGIWGTVCNLDWDLQDANVVCRELGYSGAVAAVYNARYKYGLGTGMIWMAGVDCNGNEASLLKCRQRYGWGVTTCSLEQDAGVVCISPPESKVRLENAGNSSFFGRVEVLHSGTWGTICSNLWDLQDAEVVCRQLGFDGALAAPRYAAFGEGTGQIWLDDVRCVGNEKYISQCGHNGWGIHNCRHSSDASVHCKPQVRLVGGPSVREGVVQVYLNNTWGWVCADQWDKRDADVACRMMGFPGASSAPQKSSAVEQGDLILMHDLQCTGNENSLFSCVRGLRNHSCLSGYKAGVVCIVPEVRLVAGGLAPYQGRVEILVGGLWGTVCEDSWDLHDAQAVCRQLGYDGALAAPKEAAFGRGTAALWISDVQCKGNESSLSDCWKSRQLYCMESDDASVVCTPPVRLIGGATAREGLLQVYHNNTWGWVCAEKWDIQDADVVCREISYTETGYVYVMQSGAVNEQGNETAWMNNVQCFGNETSLFSCRHDGWTNHICTNRTRAGVKCIGLEVRLAGGNSSLHGRVEVLYNGIWGTVCNLDWDLQDANVVCRELGYSGAVAGVYNATDIYGQGTGAIWMAGVECKGNEASLLKCNQSKIGENHCGHDQDAGVICIASDSVGQPQFIANDLESITMGWNSSRSMNFTVDYWNNDTSSWQDTRCYASTAVGSCMVNNPRATVINLRPSTLYIFRISARDSIISPASKEMKTKELDAPGIPFFVSNSLGAITIRWSPIGLQTVTYTINMIPVDGGVWMNVTCKESVRPNQCTVTGTTAVIFGLTENVLYRFRVYSNYKGVRSAPSLPSEAWKTADAGDVELCNCS